MSLIIERSCVQDLCEWKTVIKASSRAIKNIQQFKILDFILCLIKLNQL